MRTRIAIEQPVDAPDGAGGFTTTWTTFTSAWASVEFVTPRKGGEEQFADATRATAYAKITMPWQAGILEKMRVNIAAQGLILNIRNLVDPDLRHRYLVILAESGVAP